MRAGTWHADRVVKNSKKQAVPIPEGRRMLAGMAAPHTPLLPKRRLTWHRLTAVAALACAAAVVLFFVATLQQPVVGDSDGWLAEKAQRQPQKVQRRGSMKPGLSEHPHSKQAHQQKQQKQQVKQKQMQHKGSPALESPKKAVVKSPKKAVAEAPKKAVVEAPKKGASKERPVGWGTPDTEKGSSFFPSDGAHPPYQPPGPEIQIAAPGAEAVAVAVEEAAAVAAAAPPPADVLPIYWINLDKSVERRAHMETQFEQLSSVRANRVVAYNGDDVKRLASAGQLNTKSKMIEECTNPSTCYANHVADQFLTKEFGCTLSHLAAIQQAFDNGDDVALILEDDVIMTQKFVDIFTAYSKDAPDDWQILQLFTNNIVILQHLHQLDNDQFIQWMPDHWGTTAYLINRAGMQAILGTLSKSSGGGGGSGWVFPKDGVIVADELLYSTARTYTSTYPFFRVMPSVSEVQPANIADVRVLDRLYYAKQSAAQIFPAETQIDAVSSLMVVESIYLKEAAKVAPAIAKLKLNMMALARHGTPVWEVFVVLKDPTLEAGLRRAWNTILAEFGSAARLNVKHSPGRFNRWVYVRDLLDKMLHYDHVLMVDDDLPFQGYAWHEFFSRVEASHAVVTGIARQNIDESLLINSNTPNRQWFQIFDGSWWKTPWNVGVKSISSDFVEMFFTMFNGRFASSFFTNILADQFLIDPATGVYMTSTWGPDLLWCGAAKDWLGQRSLPGNPCLLVPLDIEHQDNREIADYLSAEDLVGHDMYVRNFPRWASYSAPFRNTYGGTRARTAVTSLNFNGLTKGHLQNASSASVAYQVAMERTALFWKTVGFSDSELSLMHNEEARTRSQHQPVMQHTIYHGMDLRKRENSQPDLAKQAGQDKLSEEAVSRSKQLKKLSWLLEDSSGDNMPQDEPAPAAPAPAALKAALKVGSPQWMEAHPSWTPAKVGDSPPAEPEAAQPAPPVAVSAPKVGMNEGGKDAVDVPANLKWLLDGGQIV